MSHWVSPCIPGNDSMELSNQQQNRLDAITSKSTVAINLKDNITCSQCHQKISGINRNQAVRVFQQQLELNVASCQVEEARASDRNNSLKENLRITESLLTALSYHAESLSLYDRATESFLNTLNEFLKKEHLVSQTDYSEDNIKDVYHIGFSQKLLLIKEKLGFNIIKTNDILKLEEEYIKRQSDFYVSSKNFTQLLINSKLDLKQLNKLKNQYDTIVVGYQHSRRVLDQELKRIIDKKKQIIADCSLELSREIDNLVDQSRKVASLYHSLSEDLYQKYRSRCASPNEIHIKSCKNCFHASSRGRPDETFSS